MHDHATPGAPPPPATDHSYDHLPPPDSPPPSYHDATQSSAAPLLVGEPPDYGAFRAYQGRDESSTTSSEPDTTDSTVFEWVGQALVLFVFFGILYGFWRIINTPEDRGGFPT